MTPFIQDLSIYQGDRFELFFRLYNMVWDEGTETFIKGPYVNLTGHTVTGSIKARRGASEAVVATWSCTLSDQSDEDSVGGILCVLLPSESVKLSDSSYVYDIQTSLDADHVSTWLTGSISTTLEVTGNG